MKEYRIAKGWAIFIYLFALLLIGVFSWLLIVPFQNGDFSPNASWTLVPISIAMIVIMVYGVIDTYKGRLIIRNDKIITANSFSKRELKFNEIRGFTVNDNYILVEPNDKKKNRIKISKYLGGYGEILLWFYEHYPNLDKENALKEEQEILNNETIGWTREVREDKLSKAKQTAKLINWAAGITTAWTLFYPKPYQYSILTAMIIPIIALLIVKFFNGLIRVDHKKGSAYPSVSYAFIYPSIGLMLRALLDYEIFDYKNVWLPTVAITIGFLFILLFLQNEITFKKKIDFLTVASLSLLLFTYSFGTVIHYNCYYDKTEPKYYTAKVLNKKISSGRSTTRYLKLTPWGPQKRIEEISVGKDLFNRIEIGDQVNISFRQGNIDIPWFIITKN